MASATDWLAYARSLGPDYERGALDCVEGRLERTAAFLQGRPRRGSEEVHPWGLADGGLWEPWRRARDEVERLPQDPQASGAQVDYLVYDRAAGSILLGKLGAWRPGCRRFTDRECPRMAPMGHDSPHAECNYWAWPGMASAAPGVELFPEWQRFDCSLYYPLFQRHLCGEALGRILGATPRWLIHAPAEARAGLRRYAALTSRPDAFDFDPLP